ncbi:YaiI/YqxD family protein [Romboutsia sedimentorum]|uniref:YaiI/YqxD family protein n=1 Tax=Romboutsia sedimentorum TaxID=1368474 RepID=UPI0024DEEFBC|nr:YaiI/YqxD family protein [Romboutsia sedimentorum]MDK2586134.1 YaiI/YqxD family protein [Romboutsia sedimentorum]
MKILIDADGCPVVDETIKIASKYNIEVIIMCDTSHTFNKDGVQTIILSKGADSVDFALVNRANKGDIVVTQDYGLAAMVLSKGGLAINQNGRVYNNNNIDQLLLTRHLSKKMRSAGVRSKGPKKRTKEDDRSFEEGLVKLCENIIVN